MENEKEARFNGEANEKEHASLLNGGGYGYLRML